MRAESKIRNLTYVVKPQTYVTDAQGHKIGTTDSFRIVFGGLRSFFWDSESFEDPQKREVAENYLRNHQDNGVLFHLVDEPTAPGPDPRYAEGRISTAGEGAPVAETVCVSTIVEPGQESRLCGKPAAEGSELCEDCAAKAAEANV